jgi:hypothetical protein
MTGMTGIIGIRHLHLRRIGETRMITEILLRLLRTKCG